MLWAAIRAMIWGLLLFIVGAVTVFSAVLGVTKLTTLRSENYAVQAGLTLAKIEPDMKRLDSILSKRSLLDDFRKKFPQYNDMSDANLTNSLYSKHYSDMPRAEFDKKMGEAESDAQLSDLRDRIRKTIREGCDCLYFFPTKSVEVLTATTELQQKANPENVAWYNIGLFVASFAGFVTFVVGSHFIATLLYAKRLSWLGVLINGALGVPFLLVGSAFWFFHLEESVYGYEYKLGDGSPDFHYWLIWGAALYLFVGYPPIFVVASRAKIKIQDALRLRALSH